MKTYLLSLLIVLCVFCLGAGGNCKPKRPMGGGGGGGGPKAGNPQPRGGKPSKKGAEDDLERDAREGDNRLNDGEERRADERQRERDGLSQGTPADGPGGPSPITPQPTPSPGSTPQFGQLPRTQPGQDPGFQQFSGSDEDTGAPAALPGLPGSNSPNPSTEPLGPQRGVRRRPKTH